MVEVYNSLMKSPLFSIALLLAVIGPAPAEIADPDFSEAQLARWEARFRAADTDDNRGLDRDEVAAALPGGVLRQFEATDADGDGLLQPEEMLARQRLLKEQREARRRRFGGRP